MKFTLLIGAEHRPTDSMMQRLAEHVEQVRLAREVGFDSIVIGSHLSYGTAAWFPPIETLMRLSAVADGMSLGTCMLVLPLFHPVEVAEQFALLDAACGGRAVMGVSPGWTQSEFDLVGLDFSKRIGRFTEAVSLIKRLYTENEITFEGKHFRINNATLALKSTQKPRPPMWLGGSVEAAVKRVASIAETELGDTWCASSHLKTDVIVQQATVFKATLKELGKPMPKDFPVLRNVVVASDRATAVREVGPAIAESYKILGNWGLFKEVVGDAQLHPEFDELINGRFIIGSPEQAAEDITQLATATGATRMVCRSQWVGMDHKHVMRTIELVGTKVAPLVRKALA
jgi:alkanesulfonate monooxygenase SsuD/methylene tetrahydromethanopterin reductase-like flavin-dependent oxidoreductase (luciferase family)